MTIAIRRAAAPAALAFSAALSAIFAAAPAAAAPGVFLAEVDTLGFDMIDGALGGTGFSTTRIVFEGHADTDDLLVFGPDVYGLAFDQAFVTIDGVGTAELLDSIGIAFDDAADVLRIGVTTAVSPFGSASPIAGAPSWDLTTDLAPLAVIYNIIDWTTLDPGFLATSLGQLSLDFGPDGDGTAPGFISARISDVPVPAAAPLLAAALGLVAFRARRA